MQPTEMERLRCRGKPGTHVFAMQIDEESIEETKEELRTLRQQRQIILEMPATTLTTELTAKIVVQIVEFKTNEEEAMPPYRRITHAVAKAANADKKFDKTMLNRAASDKCMDASKAQWAEQRIALAFASESALQELEETKHTFKELKEKFAEGDVTIVNTEQAKIQESWRIVEQEKRKLQQEHQLETRSCSSTPQR